MTDVKFIDKRQDADQDQGPSVEDQHSDELDRQARRAAIRSEMARNQVALEKAAMLESEIAESHARVELAADQHRQECEPLQSELERLERDAIHRIASRAPADQDADRRRRELIKKITKANGQLETIIADEKRLRRPAENQAYRLRQDHTVPHALESRLAQPGNAHPELLIKSHVAQQAAKWAEARRQAASQAARIIERNIRAIETGKVSRSELAPQRRRLAKWQAEHQAAGDALTEALARSAAVGREIIAE